MKKKSIYFCSLFTAALMFASCSDSEVTPEETGERGAMEITIDFEKAVQSRATASTAIPPTAMANIKDLKILLYKSDGTIAYSGDISPVASTKTFADVPVGTYTVVAVANSGQSNIGTYVPVIDNGNTTPWSDFNVRQKHITGIELRHTSGTWPSFLPTGTGTVTNLNTVVAEPAEIFLAYATVTVANTSPNVTAALQLKREVAMMRVRVDEETYRTDPSTKNFDVAFTGGGVTNASIMIYRTPNYMRVGQNTDGGVSSDLTDRSVLAISGASTFSTAASGTGYGAGSVVTDNFKLWRDIIVFPNDASSRTSTASAELDQDKQYFVVISGQAGANHKYADGTVATEGAPVYWWGRVRHNFLPNMIREVNMSIKTNGMPTPPPIIVEEGGLDISVTLTPWNQNILQTDIDV